MRRAAICRDTICLLGFAVSTSFAADRAATAETPAALQALGIGDAQILSAEQADEVRGEGYAPFWVGGGVFVHNYVAYGAVYIESYQPTSVSIILAPEAFGFCIAH